MTAYLSRAAYDALLAAGRLDLSDAGGAVALSGVTGVSETQLNRCVRRKGVGEMLKQQSLSVFMLAEIVAFSDGQAGNTLKLLNDMAGLIALPVPDRAEVGHGPGAIADLTGEFSALVAEMADAIRDDGQISTAEIDQKDLVHKALRLARISLTLKQRWQNKLEDFDHE